jgi:hypothetical protein
LHNSVTGAADPKTWYLVTCTDCGKPLKVLGAPPEKPICLHCDIIRAAPEENRDRIRETLRPLPEEEAKETAP